MFDDSSVSYMLRIKCSRSHTNTEDSRIAKARYVQEIWTERGSGTSALWQERGNFPLLILEL